MNARPVVEIWWSERKGGRLSSTGARPERKAATYIFVVVLNLGGAKCESLGWETSVLVGFWAPGFDWGRSILAQSVTGGVSKVPLG